MVGFRKSLAAQRWCGEGKGLEIGGSAHNQFGLDTLNVDKLGDPNSVYKIHEREQCGESLPVDIVASGDDIPVEDASQDFVISSHVLEHFPNPIKALLEWNRVVKPGGIIFMIVPHKDRTVDSPRQRTSLGHLIADYINDDTKGHGEEGSHHHVWVTQDIVELVNWMNNHFVLNWTVVEVQDSDDKVGNGFTVVIKKSDQ